VTEDIDRYKAFTPTLRFRINITSIFLKKLTEASHSYILYRKTQFLLHRKCAVFLFQRAIRQFSIEK